MTFRYSERSDNSYNVGNMVIAMSVTIIDLIVAERKREGGRGKHESTTSLTRIRWINFLFLGNCAYRVANLKRYRLKRFKLREAISAKRRLLIRIFRDFNCPANFRRDFTFSATDGQWHRTKTTPRSYQIGRKKSFTFGGLCSKQPSDKNTIAIAWHRHISIKCGVMTVWAA